MKSLPRIGIVGEQTFVVESRHAIEFATEGMPAVLSTPQLIAALERTAREVLSGSLEADERSVGTEIDLRHFAPTPLGQQVTCIARVIRAEGREVSFQVEARDEREIIARGVHKRAVIRVGTFARRVESKR